MERVQGWRPVICSAGVLAFSLCGHELLYILLPVHAEAYGVSLAWVGIILSTNRFVRIIAYGGVARIGTQFGARRLSMLAAAAASISTLICSITLGPWPLFSARLLWGLASTALHLMSFVYAVAEPKRSASRVGVSQSIIELGSAGALVLGAWLASRLGPSLAFVVFGLVSLLAVPLAAALPETRAQQDQAPRSWFSKPTGLDGLYFILGFGVDGTFMMTITLLIAKSSAVDTAVVTGGLILAVYHFAIMLLTPIGGILGDRFGGLRVLVWATGGLVLGFVCLAGGYVMTGVLLVIASRSFFATVGPAVIAFQHPNDAMKRLSVMHQFREGGRALGILVTGILLSWIDIIVLYGAFIIILFFAFLRQWQELKRQ